MTDHSEHFGMGPLDGDTLMAQLTELDPIKDQELTVDVAGIIRRVTSERRPLTMRSFRVRVAAALVGTTSLVVAGIAALTVSASLPVITLTSSPGIVQTDTATPASLTVAVGYSFWGTQGIQYNEPMMFRASPSLVTPSSAPASLLSTPNRINEAAHLAGDFGVTASPSNASGSIRYRDASGSEMFYSPASGLPYFLYLRDATGPDYSTLGGKLHRTPSFGGSGNVSTDHRNATNLISSLGLAYQVGPTVPTYGDVTPKTTGVTTAFVTFNYPVVVDGLRTDQVMRFTYSNSGVLLEAEAPVFSVAMNHTYPLVSATSAAASMTRAEAARDSSSQTSSSVPSSGASHSTVDLILNHADVGLMTYRDTKGDYWMLPTYWFSTSTTKTDISRTRGVYSWLAVSRKFVKSNAGSEIVP